MKNIIIVILAISVITLGYLNIKSAGQSEISKNNDKESKVIPEITSVTNKTASNSVIEPSSNKTIPAQTEHRTPRHSICIDNSSTDTACIVDSSLEIEKYLVDESSQTARLGAIAELLRSENFPEITNSLAASKITEKAFNNEREFNNQLNDFINQSETLIYSEGVLCGEQVCTAQFSYQSADDWTVFNRAYFGNKGSTFVHNYDHEDGQLTITKVVFLPAIDKVASTKTIAFQ